MSGSEIVLEHEVLTVLRENDLETPSFTVLNDPEEASEVPFDPPYTVKLLHPEVTHRARVGAMFTAVPSKRHLEQRVSELLDRWSDAVGVIVQEYVDVVRGIEAFLGMKEDETFGTVTLLGLGGKLVEDVRAYIVRRPPVEADDVERGLRRTPGGDRLLSEVGPERLAETVNTVYEIYERERWCELDLNPILLMDGSVLVLDGLARKRTSKS